MEEIWKDIMNFENYYQVSNMGNVKSLDRYIHTKNGKIQFIKSRIMKVTIDKDGCAKVNLSKDGIKTTCSVARITYKAFNPDFDYYNAYSVVFHKDENQTNNYIDNLYVAEKRNAPILAEMTEYSPCTKKQVRCITTNKEFDSIAEASEYYGIEFSSISKCCNGKQKSAGQLFNGIKLVWEFIEL